MFSNLPERRRYRQLNGGEKVARGLFIAASKTAPWLLILATEEAIQNWSAVFPARCCIFMLTLLLFAAMDTLFLPFLLLKTDLLVKKEYLLMQDEESEHRDVTGGDSAKLGPVESIHIEDKRLSADDGQGDIIEEGELSDESSGQKMA